MSSLRVPFPKYLNRKRLFFKWEYDIVLVSVSIATLFFFYLLWFGFNLILDLFLSLVVLYFSFKYYKKFFKDKKRAWIKHKLYSMGIIKPYKDNNPNVKEEDKKILPFGFESEFSG